MACPCRIPGTCECVKLHGKRDFAERIKGVDLKMEKLFWVIQMGSL
jgi:hypothetical protein